MPKRFFGGEVWGCIDPLPCSCIEEFDVSPYADLLDEVLGAFESQNFCKDYTAGVRGRHEANATFRKSHEGNYGKRIALAVKLHEFLTNAGLRVRDWASDVYALSARQGLDRIDKAA